MKKQNEHGSTAVVAIVVLVLVGVVGFAAFRVGQAPNEPQKPAEAQKWEDRPENKHYKPYAGDSRFKLSEGYTEVYENREFGYEYSFYPGFPDAYPTEPRDKFVSESNDKSEVVFKMDVVGVRVVANKTTNPTYENCLTDAISNQLKTQGFAVKSYRDTYIHTVPTRLHNYVKPAIANQTASESILVYSTPYKNRCVNVLMQMGTEVDIDWATKYPGVPAEPDPGPIGNLRFSDYNY